ncbi:MAG: glucosidase [Actinomycetota bacterium]|nr:glucosidase [Actinomycetota bacterium]
MAEPGPAWRQWGPYLAERAWGTVREDYSANGDAWGYFPHDHARSRAYRWSEDGLAGICDLDQTLCFAFAFWNGADPILKERIFGLSGPEGNHGEDAKEYWWYLDSTPTHSYLAWRYCYPQRAFPYAALVEENRRRSRLEPEYELVDTGILEEDRYFLISIEYAKAAPEDLAIRVQVENHGPEPAQLHVLPTLWFRNTWAWVEGAERPQISAAPGRLLAAHPKLGAMALEYEKPLDAWFCENESNVARLWGASATTPYPKDGIGDHLVSGAATVNPAMVGTKASLHQVMSIPAGASATMHLRLHREGVGAPGLDAPSLARWLATRRQEADEFYGALTPPDATGDEAAVMRQAFAGMLWSKQFYRYDVARWLEGDPTMPAPPPERKQGRNASWWHLDNHDVISMPDVWEYPWYASWDLAFHCITLAHVAPEFAKAQLLTLCREWYMHPNGQLPAYEWSFGDVNPPVHAFAALRVFEIDGARDYAFLERILAKLSINFTWWVNRKDAVGDNVFEGGFLGLDNIGPIDRSAALPDGELLEQADGTSWMAKYCLDLFELSLTLARHDPTYQDLAVKYFEHFAYIADAIYRQGLWDEDDGFFYDVLRRGDEEVALKVRSVVGLMPLCATAILPAESLEALPYFAEHFEWFVSHKARFASHVRPCANGKDYLLSIVDPARLARLTSVMLDESELLSPHGLRALSAAHRDRPFRLDLGGAVASVDYEPGESTTALFGGNSNWRGPVWFPVNYLLIDALRCFARALGPTFRVPMPAPSGDAADLGAIADELSRRLVSLFCEDGTGRRAVFGDVEYFQRPGPLHGLIPFHEYFHGDSGKGLGASHQTGWTGLVADLIAARRPPDRSR